MRIYVGNLGTETTDQDLRDTFSPYGEVKTAAVTTEHGSRRSRGYGFVEMPLMTTSLKAIQALKGSILHGQVLTVYTARP
ncbi:MAG: RNA-binding protein [Chloroflexi bacterium]|nr:RNA-binding protein [Chloroflexota bacterium]